MTSKPDTSPSQPETNNAGAPRKMPEARLPFDGATILTYHALEQRIVFDAATAVVVDAVSTDAFANLSTADFANSASTESSATISSSVEASQLAAAIAGTMPSGDNPTAASGSPQSRTFVFIDPDISDPAVIAAAVTPEAEIVVLERDRDGMEQIAGALAGRTDIDAIHIVSHGSAGELQLGNAVFDTQSIGANHADELAIIKAALADDADILLYGCDVAAGETGAAFVTALGEATGADIAASIDDTGHADLRGNWDLETRTGLIEAGLIDAPEWNGLLAPLTITVSSPPSTNGLTGVGAVAVWTNAGSIGGTAIDIRATVVSADVGASVNFATAFGVDAYGPGRDADDMWLQVTNGNVTVRWEIFAAGTGQTVIAVGDPNFRISDIDGDGAVSTPFPDIEVEAVSPA